jgi:hypothetical protein
MNDSGIVTGIYVDTATVSHGFERSPSGDYTTIDAPGAAGGSGQGTYAYTINTGGAIAGCYYGANNHANGFLRNPNGGLRSFEVAWVHIPQRH